jgi:glyceraldehyde-3-phosphate dehydrogenase/erythrose-4-phosphate dehydrogenase
MTRVSVNEIGAPENLAYLVQYDTVYGPPRKQSKFSMLETRFNELEETS